MKSLFLCVCAMALFACAMASSKCFTEEDGASKTETSIDAFSAGSTKFAYDLFTKVIQDPSNPSPSGNVFISPISVWLALGDFYLGSKGQTKKELGIVLGIDKFKQETVAYYLYPKFQNGLLHIATEEANYTFNLANKLYFPKNVWFEKCSIHRTDGEVQINDEFREDSRGYMNWYVDRKTNNKIVDLIPPNHIDSNTVMVIVHAAYFKGSWESPFMDFATKDGDFFVEPNKPKKTKMMFQNGTFPTAGDSAMGCTAVQLHFSGYDMSMLILLPDSNNDVQDVIQKLTKENVDGLIGKLSLKSMELSIPKFKVEQEMELKENVRAMGVNDLFDPTKVDLSGFTGFKNTGVSFIRHKTFVEVAEYGAEAAAGTAAGVAFSSLPSPITPEFKVNSPFVFLLLNNKMKAITFIGLIKDPTATK